MQFLFISPGSSTVPQMITVVNINPETGIKEEKLDYSPHGSGYIPSVFSGPLRLPAGENCRVFDISGRVVLPEMIKPGIYFIEINGIITKKVVKTK